MSAALGVWLAGERVAELRSPRVGRLTCRYASEVLDRGPLGAPLLSCSLPLRSGPRQAWPFFSGLLPEGQHRQAMASIAGVTTLDVLGMLRRFGRDVAGAVIVSAEDPPTREAAVIAYDDAGLLQAVADLDDHPLGLYDDSELSIAGLQDKTLLVALPAGGWGRPVHGYPSTHILKVDDRVRRGLVRAEHACLRLADAAGIVAAHSELLSVGTAECIAVERFDRQVEVDGSVRRLHQEDTCQALGIDPEDNQRQAKYQQYGGPSFRQIAGLLDTWAREPEAELLNLLDQMVFTAAIGNADAHGKNIALLHDDGAIRLAPLYDTVPTVVWPQLRTAAAMKIGGVADLNRVDRDALLAEAVSWRVPRRNAEQHIDALLERLLDAVGVVDVDTPVLDVVLGRLARLLGRP